jgi:hypothetical protein
MPCSMSCQVSVNRYQIKGLDECTQRQAIVYNLPRLEPEKRKKRSCCGEAG